MVDSALFYQPGKSGFYSPRVAAPTSERLNAFRNVGRMIGLSLLHAETMPLPLCRHVIKFLLKRSVSQFCTCMLDVRKHTNVYTLRRSCLALEAVSLKCIISL